jgi:UDP-N-acetylglucosamine 2-epimerase
VFNLEKEAVSRKIFSTGDLSLVLSEAVRISSAEYQIFKDLRLKPRSYNSFTMHREENTDFHENIDSVINAFQRYHENWYEKGHKKAVE